VPVFLSRLVTTLPIFFALRQVDCAIERAGKAAEEAFAGGTSRRRQPSFVAAGRPSIVASRPPAHADSHQEQERYGYDETERRHRAVATEVLNSTEPTQRGRAAPNLEKMQLGRTNRLRAAWNSFVLD
jgi:hypothetical protein